MGMGRKKDREKQQDLWVAASEMVTTPGHVFYERLNVVLNAEKFDQRVEAICRKYYKSSSGRPSLTPGTYFRMLLLGYFEGIDSERGIAWRAADSFSFRKFLGYDLSEQRPDHTTVSRTRRLYSVETHRAVMQWVLKILRKHGNVKSHPPPPPPKRSEKCPDDHGGDHQGQGNDGHDCRGDH